jgi:hypothetical protein
MRHPDTGDIDDRHLCEYGLVREIRGQKSARRLAMKDWVCLEASYPAGSAFSPVGERWPRLSEQIFRIDKWSVCRG